MAVLTECDPDCNWRPATGVPPMYGATAERCRCNRTRWALPQRSESPWDGSRPVFGTNRLTGAEHKLMTELETEACGY